MRCTIWSMLTANWPCCASSSRPRPAARESSRWQPQRRRMITDATGTDVCFVHVLDDTRPIADAGRRHPAIRQQVGRIRLPLGSGISGWVASHREPVVIISRQGIRPALHARSIRCGVRTSPRWRRCRWRQTRADWSECSTYTRSQRREFTAARRGAVACDRPPDRGRAASGAAAPPTGRPASAPTRTSSSR